MRLFLAIEPDDRARVALEETVTRLKRAAGERARAFRWSVPQALHITVHFLGEMEPASLSELQRVLEPPLDQPIFRAGTGAIGTFPADGTPRVVWLSISEGAGAMIRVHRQLADRLGHIRLPMDARPLTPHFTMARARDGERRDVRTAALMMRREPIETAAWTVKEITLFRSHLSSGPPRYEALGRTALAPGAT